MIEEFKDELKSWKNIFNEIKKTRIIKRTRNKIRNEIKRKLNILHDEVKTILEKLHVVLTTLITKYKFFEKPHDFEWVEKERIKNISKSKNKWIKKD